MQALATTLQHLTTLSGKLKVNTRRAKSLSSSALHARHSFRPSIEALEDRLVLSAPAAPSSFVASDISGTQVSLSWHPSSGATSYVIDEWVNGAWKQIGSISSNYSACTVSGLSAGNTYYFDVAASNSDGTTWANYVSITTVDHPSAGGSYSQVNGSLFGSNGPSYRDVQQGGVGDCWLLASLAEVSAREPSVIRSMFTSLGSERENGSVVSLYSVRLYDGSGNAHSIIVDTELPSGGGMYDRPANGVLWVALAEKAYAQANGLSFVTSGNVGSDSYAALNGGDPSWALHAITGKSTGDFSINPSNIAAAWNAGKLIVLGSSSSPSSQYIVGGSDGTHAYAVVAYNASSSMPFEVYNPWGSDSSGWALGTYHGHQVYGLFWANGAFLSGNFAAQFIGAGAEQDHVNTPGSVASTANFSQVRKSSDFAVTGPATSTLDALFAHARHVARLGKVTLPSDDFATA